MMRPKSSVAKGLALRIARKLNTFYLEDKLIEYLDKSEIKKYVESYCKSLGQRLAKLRDEYWKKASIMEWDPQDIEAVFDEIFFEVEKRCRRFLMAKRHVVEPVRLGEYKDLLIDTYDHVQGKLYPTIPVFNDFQSIVIHGLLRENTIVISPSDNGPPSLRKYYHGIDWALFLRFPAEGGEKHYINLPFLVTVKYDMKELKKSGFSLRELVGEVIENVGEPRIRLALEHIPEFTRVVFVRGPDQPFDPNRYLSENPYLIYRGTSCYRDILFGILSPVFMDIPRLYNYILDNEELQSLDVSDWKTALMFLSIPIIPEIYYSRTPPRSDGGGGMSLNDLAKEIANAFNSLPQPKPAFTPQDIEEILKKKFNDIEAAQYTLQKTLKELSKETNTIRHRNVVTY